MAAKSLIQLYRSLNPALLHRKYRGQPTEFTKELKPQQYGHVQAPSFIPGAECLVAEPDAEAEAPADDGFESDSDDESGSWIAVSSEGEEEEEGDEAAEADENSNEGNAADGTNEAPADPTDPEIEPAAMNSSEKAEIISSSRILTDEEFRRIEAFQLSKKVLRAKGKKRKAAPFDGAGGGGDERKSGLPRLSDIEKLYKKPRQDKEERVASVRTGHADREKFGRPQKKDHAGRTNKSNAKNKVFSMVKHKQGRKKKRSFHDKQIALRNYLLKQKKMK